MNGKSQQEPLLWCAKRLNATLTGSWIFYAFGWESLLLESGFLAIFLGAANSEPKAAMIWLFRWLPVYDSRGAKNERLLVAAGTRGDIFPADLP